MTGESLSRAGFRSTRWSRVKRARREDPVGRRALEELCQDYWAPVYAFYRRDGMGVEEARDLCQGLFLDLIERGDLAGGDPEKGRFRTYLLACARHYRSRVREREQAQKRGGGRVAFTIALDVEREETEVDRRLHGVELVDCETPEDAFELRWAREVLSRALARLERQEEKKGKAEAFAVLRIYLEGKAPGQSYLEAASRLEVSEAAIKVAVHRLRKRFREALLLEVGQTVETAEEARTEIQDLLAAFGRRKRPQEL